MVKGGEMGGMKPLLGSSTPGGLWWWVSGCPPRIKHLDMEMAWICTLILHPRNHNCRTLRVARLTVTRRGLCVSFSDKPRDALTCVWTSFRERSTPEKISLIHSNVFYSINLESVISTPGSNSTIDCVHIHGTLSQRLLWRCKFYFTCRR